MIKDVVRGYILVSNILGLEGALKNFVDSSEKNLLEGFVGGVVLFEQRGGVGKVPEFVGNDGSSGAGSDDCTGARVDRWDENGGGEGVVESWGDR